MELDACLDTSQHDSELGKQDELRSISQFEHVFTTCPPVIESLLFQLPTLSILALLHTSTILRNFLESYPTAWRYLSFRLPQENPGTGNEPGAETNVSRSNYFALNSLLIETILPLGILLRTLELDNTLVDGQVLFSAVLPAQRGTLEHLSVRGCKDVSLKYHVTPYLTTFQTQKRVLERRGKTGAPSSQLGFALKSLYTYRSRHGRRRPYFDVSLQRRESDAVPTHEVVRLCHELGIWTDIAWCPTPGARCSRRKDYHSGRGPDNRSEVWVTYDRLWRSNNRIGRAASRGRKAKRRKGLLWEELEIGHEGEAVGNNLIDGVESKAVPAHLRPSYHTFVENVHCDDCKVMISERCEICSVKMHCMGCRKTLCASCGFDRPLPRAKEPSDTASSTGTSDEPIADAFWWAPGETRSPNSMQNPDGGAALAPGTPAPSAPSPLMRRCCERTNFSPGSTFTNVTGCLEKHRSSRLRTAPLPRGKGYEDPEIARFRLHESNYPTVSDPRLREPPVPKGHGHEQVSYAIHIKNADGEDDECPRVLCKECAATPDWCVSCPSCSEYLCFRHDMHSGKIRICGYDEISNARYKDAKRQKVEAMAHPSKAPLPSFDACCNPDRQEYRYHEGNRHISPGTKRPIAPLGPIWDRYISMLTIEPTSLPFLRYMGEYFGFRLVTKPLCSAHQTLMKSLITYAGPGDGTEINWESPIRAAIDLWRSFMPNDAVSDPRSFFLNLGHLIGYDTPDTTDSSVASSKNNKPSSSCSDSSNHYTPHPFPPIPIPAWTGCGTPYCPEFRNIADHRAPCPAKFKQCDTCKIYVCPSCVDDNPPCACSVCKESYQCPSCGVERSRESCRRREEEEERARWEAARDQADELVEMGRDFWDKIEFDVVCRETRGLVEAMERMVEAAEVGVRAEEEEGEEGGPSTLVALPWGGNSGDSEVDADMTVVGVVGSEGEGDGEGEDEDVEADPDVDVNADAEEDADATGHNTGTGVTDGSPSN
ncbi:hypothetical protein MMC25_008341 [Agyrium rufum]|nr:hypothetical protein [Agyrium rufum]MCJ1314659.1 hypothetical protein [Agyrium rufum]